MATAHYLYREEVLMARLFVLSLILLPAGLLADSAWSAPTLVDSAPQYSEQTPLDQQHSAATQAKAWG